MTVICESNGIIDKIEQLQLCQNQKVYEKSIDLLEKYFILEEQEDIMEMISAPSTANATPTQETNSLWGNQSAAGGQQTFQF